MFGKNYDMTINYVNAFLEGNYYRIRVPYEEYFIVFCNVPSDTANQIPQYSDFRLFNVNDTDITDEIFKKFSS